MLSHPLHMKAKDITMDHVRYKKCWELSHTSYIGENISVKKNMMLKRVGVTYSGWSKHISIYKYLNAVAISCIFMCDVLMCTQTNLELMATQQHVLV